MWTSYQVRRLLRATLESLGQQRRLVDRSRPAARPVRSVIAPADNVEHLLVSSRERDARGRPRHRNGPEQFAGCAEYLNAGWSGDIEPTFRVNGDSIAARPDR